MPPGGTNGRVGRRARGTAAPGMVATVGLTRGLSGGAGAVAAARAGSRGCPDGPANGARGPAAGAPVPVVSLGIGFTGVPLGRTGALCVVSSFAGVVEGALTGTAAAGLDRVTGGAATGGAGGPSPCFSGGRKACTGGRNGIPPRAIGGADRMFGRAFPDPDPAAGRVDLGVGASGGGRSNSMGSRLDSGEEADSVTPGAPNHTRTLTAVSESTELEWVFGFSTPTAGNIARISPALTSNSRANSLIRMFDVRVKTALTP